MSLFSSIQLANNSLRAQQIGLQVTGQNISNANTPGYIREEVVFKPAPTQRIGSLLLGLGVDVEAVVQKTDKFLEERLRNASSDRHDTEIQKETYLQLEGILGELSDTDLSTALSNLSAAIQDVLAQPEDLAARNLAVLQGRTLGQDIVRLAERVTDVRNDVNQRIDNIASDINQRIAEITKFNVRIAFTEGGDASGSEAVGLRDLRGIALSELAELIDIDAVEQPSGAVNVFAGGDFLVLEGSGREVTSVRTSVQGLTVSTIRVKETDSPLQHSSGELAGLIASRDDVLGGFLTKLNEFASTLAFGFNQIYSSGEGLTGFQELTAEFSVDDADLALDQAGLYRPPVNGGFQIKILNKQTNSTQTYDINVRLNGLSDDTTMDDLVSQLDAIDSLSASVSATGVLSLSSNSVDQEFSFSNDSSGLLAVLGLNTFFSGSTATDLGINQDLLDDPAKFAASQSGIGPDTGNAIAMIDFLDRQLQSGSEDTLSSLYERFVGDVTQSATVARSASDGAVVFEESLRGQWLGIAGVSLDEEAVRMIQYQRAYQAAARYIGVLSELMGLLVNL